MNDTIIAVATGKLSSAIGIIRVSGPDAFKITSNITDIDISKMGTFTIKFANVVDDKKIIDEILVKKFIAPKTFTGEDIIEIDCHGGAVVKKMIMTLLIKFGARIAEPGEFSRRAYLNNKIDLSKAEAIHDLVFAKTEIAHELSINALKGSVSKMIEELRSDMIQIIGHIEVNIDYPEYDDYEMLTTEKLLPLSISMKERMVSIIDDAKLAKIAKDGINIAIVGKPNVGKSSLLNSFIGEERAIVTDIEGTTRDIIEESVLLDGTLLNFIDTAGIRESSDIVEQKGIDRTLKTIEHADVILAVVDGSKQLGEKDLAVLKLTEDMNRIIVMNKNDQGVNSDLEGISISAKNNDIEQLITELKTMFELGKIVPQDNGYLINERQVGLLSKALLSLESAIEAMNNNVPIDLFAIDLNNTWVMLGEILGVEVKENFLNEIFSRFCLGK